MDTSTSARLSTGWGHARWTEREYAHRSAFARGPLSTESRKRVTVSATPLSDDFRDRRARARRRGNTSVTVHVDRRNSSL